MIFTGVQENPADYFRVYNVFLLTSKEDPFPLVCLEAAALKKPVICFKRSGGMNEFIEQGGGVSVDYGSVEQLAAAIVDLKNDKNRLEEMSKAAAVSAHNYDVNVIAPSLFKTISQISVRPMHE